MKLSKNERFLKEYTDFKNKINNISDDARKKELLELLKQMVAEVNAIDQQYEELSVAFSTTNNTTDHKSNLLNIRKRLAKKLDNVNY